MGVIFVIIIIPFYFMQVFYGPSDYIEEVMFIFGPITLLVLIGSWLGASKLNDKFQKGNPDCLSYRLGTRSVSLG